ncbi:MAG: S41 family peptidase [Nitriliruptorales bacterium]|nr:S41 family peptidase [Nitriliruptorales bacterium]
MKTVQRPFGSRHLSGLLLVAALLVGGCAVPFAAEDDGPPVTSPSPSQPSPEVVSPSPSDRAAPADYRTATCEEPPSDWALFCEVTELIADRHVDPPSPQVLADAAAEGLAELADAPDAEGFTCAIPDAAFRELCDALAAAGGPDPATIEAAIRAMVTGGLDLNSSYQDAEQFARSKEDQSGQVEGIGALVTTEDRTAEDPEGTKCSELSDTCRLVIVSVFDGAPADEAGLEAGDEIVSVDGTDVAGETIDEAVDRVRGPAGTAVELGILHDGELRDVTITRAAVDIPITETAMVADTAYLRLTLFTNDSDERFRTALRELLREDPDTLVLDLRSNPGGALSAAVSIASEFLSEGLVVRTESPEGPRDYRVDEGGLATDPSLEVLVLLNRGSASASEVVAAALHEAGRAILVGERTFGKDTVQQQFPLDEGGALKLTIARWVTPDGDGFGGGIRPDVPLEVPEDATPEEVVEAVLSATRD